MIQQFIRNQFSIGMHRRLFTQVLYCSLAVSLLVYTTIHLMFHDFPFDWKDEVVLISKMLLVSGLFAASISLLILLTDAIDYASKRGWSWYRMMPAKKWALTMLALVLLMSACSAQTPSSGVVKDMGTGLSAAYKTMKPGKVMLVMNDEVIHHTDIPLGESFMLVNNGIKGLTVKDGRVAVGCALTIRNKAGKTLLHSDDLFNGRDTFPQDSVQFLRCAVATGKPMQWEEKYNVMVVFWDKYGTGSIENKVTIRCIDLP